MEDPLLILDLDETLIHATEQVPPSGYHFRVGEYFVTKRPYTDEFLEAVDRWYRIAVWTSAGQAYADEVVEQVFTHTKDLVFVWTALRCGRVYDPEAGEYGVVKDLKKVRRRGYDLQRVLIMDDLRENARRNYGNHLHVAPFLGEPSDRELLDVLPFLEWLKEQATFRGIEKRTWRDHGTTQE